jgi:hypothetical protein
VFAADGRFVYSIESNREHNLLFRTEVATNFETVVGDVGREFRPASDNGPAIGFQPGTGWQDIRLQQCQIHGGSVVAARVFRTDGHPRSFGILSSVIRFEVGVTF